MAKAAPMKDTSYSPVAKSRGHCRMFVPELTVYYFIFNFYRIYCLYSAYIHTCIVPSFTYNGTI